MKETYVIMRSLDATEWSMTSAIDLARNSQLQIDTDERAMILVEAFEADTADDARKRFEEMRDAHRAAIYEDEVYRQIQADYVRYRRRAMRVIRKLRLSRVEAETGRQSYKESWKAAKRRFEKAEARVTELKQKLGWEQGYTDEVLEEQQEKTEKTEARVAELEAELGTLDCGTVASAELEQTELLIDNDALVEALADLEHERWSGWEKYREKVVSPVKESRWKRLRETPYAALINQEQESDRVEARKSIEVMKRHLLPFSKVRAAG